MGEGWIRNFDGTLAKRSNKDNFKKFTAESFRRLATTQLVEAGMYIVGLCESGNWCSTEIATEYTEHSTIFTGNHMSMLDGKKRSANENDDDDNVPMKKSNSVNSPVLKSATPE